MTCQYSMRLETSCTSKVTQYFRRAPMWYSAMVVVSCLTYPAVIGICPEAWDLIIFLIILATNVISSHKIIYYGKRNYLPSPQRDIIDNLLNKLIHEKAFFKKRVRTSKGLRCLYHYSSFGPVE